MVKRKDKNSSNVPKKEPRIGIFATLLIVFITALAVCISLTVVLFSVTGRTAYAKVLGRDMLKQAESIADETQRLMLGEISEDLYSLMLRTRDSSIVVLDSNKKPMIFFEERERPADVPEPPEGQPGPGSRMDRLVEPCAALYDEVAESKLIRYDRELGVVAGVPVKNDEGEVLGAVFIVRPVDDVSDSSRSLVTVLILTAAAVGLFMLVPIYFFTRWLTDPLKKLTATAAELSEGDLSSRAEIEGSLEVRELGETINGLADNLQKNIGELTVERNRLRAVLDGLGEGIIAFDTDGSVTQYNNSALRLLGLPEGELTASDISNITEAAENALKGQGSVTSFNVNDRVIRLSTAPIAEENGSVAGAVALMMDMTEAERLEQTRRDYVANVSHELRTPLASIRGVADMLNDGLVRNESDKLRYYGLILKESIRLSTLINDLLELSRLQSGGVAPELHRTELYEIIADVADRMTEPAAARGMRIDLTVPEGRYYAHSSSDRMEQVMISLVDNAVKHGSEGGVIRIGLEDAGDKWHIWTENPAEVERSDLEHLFERFYKADTAHTGEGTGLGLAITEEVLHLLGETIGVSYENGLIRFTFTAAKESAAKA